MFAEGSRIIKLCDALAAVTKERDEAVDDISAMAALAENALRKLAEAEAQVAALTIGIDDFLAWENDKPREQATKEWLDQTEKLAKLAYSGTAATSDLLARVREETFAEAVKIADKMSVRGDIARAIREHAKKGTP